MFEKIAKIGVKVGEHFAKHGHTYLAVAGAAGTVGTIALTVKATRQMDELSAKYKETEETILTHQEGHEPAEVDADLKQNKVAYVVGSIKIVAPVVALGLASLGCFALSWGISSRRFKVLASAYSLLKLEYDKYREVVREDVGEEKEREYYATTQERVVQELETVQKVDKFNIHGRWIEESDEFARDDASYNGTIVAQAKRIADDILGRDGRLIMNQLFDALGMPRTKEGMYMGWTLGDGFDLYENHVEVTDEDGTYTSMYITWPTPKPLYKELELAGGYSVLA